MIGDSETWRPRKASESRYFSPRYPTEHRIYIRGGFHSDALTALDELAAPKLWTLPRNIQDPIRARFYDMLGGYSWPEKYTAQAWIFDRTQKLIDSRLDIAYDHDQIRQLAVTYADVCACFRNDEAIEAFCTSHDVAPPEKKRTSLRGRLRRVRSISWWTRRLFKRFSRSAENGLRHSGFISRTSQLYCSHAGVAARSRRAEILSRWIDNTCVVSDAGDSLALRRVYDSSTANPTNRRHELMTRLRGMDELAQAENLAADFYTLTLPSKYHAVHHHGEMNDTFNGATVRDGQLQLRLLWTRFRAAAAKEDIFYYGMRVAEPHHDGTAHWHMVLYTLEDSRERVRELLRKYWLSEDGNEPGALEHRIRIMACDRAMGTAAGYLAKYVAKNIDGYEVGPDYESADTEKAAPEMDATQSAGRVLTWAWLHGIRQFQFFGIARVGLWRELRRLHDPVEESPALEAARAAADSGHWALFVNQIGGVYAGADTALKLWSEITGEINQYDELAGPQIVGIEAPDGYLRTRVKVWRLVRADGGIDSSDQRARIDGIGYGAVGRPRPAVTVSDTSPREDGKEPGNPIGWSNPQETSTYGPN